MMGQEFKGVEGYKPSRYDSLYDYKKEDYLFYCKDGYKAIVKGDYVCIEDVSHVHGEEVVNGYVIYDADGDIIESTCTSDEEFREIYNRVLGGILWAREVKGLSHKNTYRGEISSRDFILDGWLIRKEYINEFSISKSKSSRSKTYYRYCDGEYKMLTNTGGRTRKSLDIFVGVLEKCDMKDMMETFLEKK